MEDSEAALKRLLDILDDPQVLSVEDVEEEPELSELDLKLRESYQQKVTDVVNRMRARAGIKS